MAPRKLRPITTLLGHSSWSLRCAISADGKTAISGDGVPSARIWDLEEPSNSRGFADDLPLGIRQCALSEDGSLAAVAAEGNGVSIHEISSGKKIFTIEEPIEGKDEYKAAGCALTPDGNILVASFRTSNRRKGEIHIVRWRNPSVDPIIHKRNYSIWQCEIADDARRAAFKFWKGTKSGVELIDIRTGNSIGQWSGIVGEWNFAIDSKAKMLALADAHSLRVINMATKAETEMKSYTFSAFAGVDISANGKYVVAPLAEYKFGIWEAESGRIIAHLGGHKNRTNGCAISADGTRVVTCSNDHTVRYWDTRGATSGVGADEIRESLRMMLAGEQSDILYSQLVRSAAAECELGNSEELLQAHAALVMALRGAASRHDIDERTSVSQLAAKVYETIEGNLHDKEDVQLGQVVMAHAEQRGLLAPGLPIKHMGTYYKLNDKAINKLRENVNAAWDDVLPIGKNDNVDDELCHRLNMLYDEMHVGREGVEDAIFGTIGACILLFWTGNRQKIKVEEFRKQPRSIKSMLAVGGSKDVAWIETKMPFDISNPRVLRYLSKKSWIEKLPPRRKHLITKAIARSKFQTIEKLEIELTALIEKLARSRGKFQSVNDIDIDDLNDPVESDEEIMSRRNESLRRSSSRSMGNSDAESSVLQMSPAQKKVDYDRRSNTLFLSPKKSSVHGTKDISIEELLTPEQKQKDPESLEEILCQNSKINFRPAPEIRQDTRYSNLTSENDDASNVASEGDNARQEPEPLESESVENKNVDLPIIPKQQEVNGDENQTEDEAEILKSYILSGVETVERKDTSDNIVGRNALYLDASNTKKSDDPVSTGAIDSNLTFSPDEMKPLSGMDTLQKSPSKENLNSLSPNEASSPEQENKAEESDDLPDVESSVRKSKEFSDKIDERIISNIAVASVQVQQPNLEEVLEKEGIVQAQKETKRPQLKELDRKNTIQTYVPVEHDLGDGDKGDYMNEITAGDDQYTTSSGNYSPGGKSGDVVLEMDEDGSNKAVLRSKAIDKEARSRRRNRHNMILGIAAITSFFICAALLTLVILKVR